MISEGEKEEIRTLLKVGRSRTLNFAVCMGEEPVETVFVIHRRVKPLVLGRQAKADGTTPKVAKGRMEVDGRTLKLCCEGTVPTGLSKNLKKYLKILKLMMTVELVDEVAPLPDEDGLDEDVVQEAEPVAAESATEPPAAPEPEVSPEQTRYETMFKMMTPKIDQIEHSDHPNALKIAAIRDLAVRRAESGDYRTANKALSSLAAHI
ncbi:hypothetical protein Z945_759 [Sulfitobacter noctilucae]|uniref:hypothetical protein n=1 Tax=Sulfitobacter noctilucae TaxID=1342302 RepID=UPI00046808E8|nr:hypothetical protein [Sulfitobacter noctilucae]KIN65712.1 hypothetical protein Z945_759 [Sulfitobacter noctilucae]